LSPSFLAARRNIARAVVASAICLAALSVNTAVAAASTSPTDPFAAQQWGLTAIGAPQVWQFAQGAGVTVAVVDSGSGPHPDLTNNLEPGRTFFSLIESDGAAEVDLKDGGSKIIVENGQINKLNRDNNGITTCELLTRKWTDWIDY
jgi:subtilisin family serine protease